MQFIDCVKMQSSKPVVMLDIEDNTHSIYQI